MPLKVQNNNPHAAKPETPQTPQSLIPFARWKMDHANQLRNSFRTNRMTRYPIPLGASNSRVLEKIRKSYQDFLRPPQQPPLRVASAKTHHTKEKQSNFFCASSCGNVLDDAAAPECRVPFHWRQKKSMASDNGRSRWFFSNANRLSSNWLV